MWTSKKLRRKRELVYTRALADVCSAHLCKLYAAQHRAPADRFASLRFAARLMRQPLGGYVW